MARGKKATRKVRLTELGVRKARPQAAAYQVWDSTQRGLALRVQPTGAKSWVVVFSRQGRSRWLTLGAADAIGLADARVLAAEAMLAVARGKYPAAEKKAERSRGTFEELAARYVDEHAKKHNKSWKQADALVRRFALPAWGKLQAASIVRDDIKTMLAKIEAPVLANQVLAAVSAIYTWAVKEGIVTANPAKLIDRNPTRSRERVLAGSEVPAFWQAFDAAGPVEAASLKVILLTGQRPGEVAHMRLEHIKDGWWEMPGEPVPALDWPGTKNGQSHRVWLPAPARKLIAKTESTESALGNGGIGFVFAGARGRPVYGLDVVMREICKKLGAERATPHDLRRSFSTLVTGLGYGRDALNRLTNHREGGIASVYDRHGYADENKRIMEAVAGEIMRLVEGRTDDDNVVRTDFGR
jgi:integrase